MRVSKGLKYRMKAAELRAIEQRYRGAGDVVPALVDAIRARYDLRDDTLPRAG